MHIQNDALLSDDAWIQVGIEQAWEDYLAEKEQGYSDIADDVLPRLLARS